MPVRVATSSPNWRHVGLRMILEIRKFGLTGTGGDQTEDLSGRDQRLSSFVREEFATYHVGLLRERFCRLG